MVESVYRQLNINGFIPNVYTYGILIKGHCREGHFGKALDVFKEMEEAGVKPYAFIYGTYIHGLCSKGETDVAFRIVKTLRESNKPVDVFAYTCIIRGFVRESKLQDAEEVFLEMKLGEVVPDANCYGALIRGYCQEGETILDLRKEMEARCIKSDRAGMRCMMQYLCGVGRLNEALYLLKYFMQSPTVFIDGVTFNFGIDAACKLGKMEDAMGFLEGMKSRKMKPWNVHYKTLMDGYCLRGEPWNALYIFQEMMRDGLKPDSTTYHVLARGFQGCGVSLPLYMLFKPVR